MTNIHLPGSACATSQLGFGCARLFGGWEERRSTSLLKRAYDLGFRHFDVAPSYGLGSAEATLGKAFGGSRDKVTIASKAGIGRPRCGNLLLTARRALAPLNKTPLGKMLGRKAYAATTCKGEFDPARVEQSLHASLKNLKTDYLDLLLLHDVESEQVTDALLDRLSRFRNEGKVLSIGTATSLHETRQIQQRFGAAFDVWQRAWDIFNPQDAEFPPFTITHGSLHRAFAALKRSFAESPEQARLCSDKASVDLADSVCLSRTLIGASIAKNPHGITLVGTRNAQRLSENAAVMQDPRWQTAGQALYTFLNSDAGCLLLGHEFRRAGAHP